MHKNEADQNKKCVLADMWADQVQDQADREKREDKKERAQIHDGSSLKRFQKRLRGNGCVLMHNEQDIISCISTTELESRSYCSTP